MSLVAGCEEGGGTGVRHVRRGWSTLVCSVGRRIWADVSIISAYLHGKAEQLLLWSALKGQWLRLQVATMLF